MQAAMGKHLKRAFWVMAALSVLAYLATLPVPRVDGHIIGSDGLYLYAYLPSVWLDGTLDMTAPYTRYLAEGLRGTLPDPVTATGMLPNVWPVGPAILWTPFFWLADLAARLVGATRDGYGMLYEGMVCLGTVLYGLSGLWALARLLARRYSEHVAILTLVSVWAATNLIYYLLLEPSMGHALSFAATAWFLAVRDRTARDRTKKERTLWQWAGLGALVGVAALIRTQNIVLGAILLLDLWNLHRNDGAWPAVVRALVAAGLGGLAALMPQLITWRIMYGAWATIPQGEAFMNWTSPAMLRILFSSRHGLLLWHPLYALGLIGLALRLRERDARPEAIALLIVFVLQWYINAAAHPWWADDSFGLRRFLSTGPIVALGLAELLARWTTRKRGWVQAKVAMGVLIVWNLLFAAQYRLGFIPMDQALTSRQFIWEKFTLPFDLIQRVLEFIR